jgi:hypothetical protein
MKSEVQLTHEKTEWTYSVHLMTEEGCAESHRFEYDKDKPHTVGEARSDAIEKYTDLRRANPAATCYSDIV